MIEYNDDYKLIISLCNFIGKTKRRNYIDIFFSKLAEQILLKMDQKDMDNNKLVGFLFMILLCSEQIKKSKFREMLFIKNTKNYIINNNDNNTYTPCDILYHFVKQKLNITLDMKNINQISPIIKHIMTEISPQLYTYIYDMFYQLYQDEKKQQNKLSI